MLKTHIANYEKHLREQGFSGEEIDRLITAFTQGYTVAVEVAQNFVANIPELKELFERADQLTHK